MDQWQGEAKRRSTTEAVFRPDLSARGLYDSTRDRQSEAGAFFFCRIERIKNLIELMTGDAGSGITYGHLRGRVAEQGCVNGYCARVQAATSHRVHPISCQNQSYLQ